LNGNRSFKILAKEPF